MDGFIVKFENRQWRFRPQGPKAKKWAAIINPHGPAELVVPIENVPSVWREMVAENLNDFDDQREVFRIAQAQRSAGAGHEALVALMRLRSALLSAVDPRSAGLLPSVDREIAASLDRCRTDRDHRGWLRIPGGRFWVKLRRASVDFEKSAMRIAVSIMSAIHLWTVIWS